ncbi:MULTISPECIES: glycosyltransferase family 8 protein [unclassified Oceanobacillus]|uniref:glycosyltransferase family 8 protein n=1 Tax=unclassified Oceanobacillus TaxID=2630292 RepID=UPI00300E0F00
MNILVTLNSNYINPLKTMLKSLFVNNPGESFAIYLMHSSIEDEELDDLMRYIQQEGQELVVITVEEKHFSNAPVVKHFTKEMYYRLLAYQMLPQELDRILYLDPDILVINEIRTLYDMEISEHLYAAAFHDRSILSDINKIRFPGYEIDEYYNSGVLLMNLERQRMEIKEEEIYKFVEENRKKLILPDQDILNGLYSAKIKNIDEILYNFDARFYLYYRLANKNKIDMDYVIHNTAIIHFCGKKKPWHVNYSGKFHSLYKHYERIALG